ncbi:MAG: hypothetical protein ACT4PZ_14015 [Panacagrimonas sp.]
MIPVSTAGDEDSDPAVPKRSGLLIAPFVWVPGIRGPVGTGTTRQSIDLSSSDLLSNAESGAMGYLRWTFGRQFVYFEGVEASFRDEGFDSFFGQDVDSSIVMLEAGYGLDFRMNVSMLPQGHIWLSPYLGVRYASLDVSIGLIDPIRTFLENPAAALAALQQQVPMEVSEEIVDLALGLFVDVPLTKRLSFLLKLDGAGFDLDRSNYWNGSGVLGYDFSDHWSIFAGYRVARIEAEAGDGNELNLDWRLGGPIGSLVYSF